MLHRIIARIPTGPEPKTTPTRPGFHLVWLVCFTAKLVAVTTIFVLLLGNSANATQQPYGGCKEAWQAPHSAGAQWCRAHGWTVTRNLVVTPKGWVVFTQLPHCDVTTGIRPCTWNVNTSSDPKVYDGDGFGRAFWIDHHNRTHYVLGTRMRPADKVDPPFLDCSYENCGIVGSNERIR